MIGPPDGVRLSDAERERLADILAAHSAAGRLTIAELEDRVSAVYRAQTRGEADALVADLPALPAPGPQRVRRRGLGHGETHEPDPAWRATNERFRDPTSRRIMRVWIDPASGTRHYVPDEA